jgi:hypothetical protein
MMMASPPSIAACWPRLPSVWALPRALRLSSAPAALAMAAITATPPPTHAVHITHGVRRAHRPDLNHVRLEWMVEPHAGISGLMKPLSGTSRDAPACGQVVRAHMAPLHTTDATTSLVADRALL